METLFATLQEIPEENLALWIVSLDCNNIYSAIYWTTFVVFHMVKEHISCLKILWDIPYTPTFGWMIIIVLLIFAINSSFHPMPTLVPMDSYQERYQAIMWKFTWVHRTNGYSILKCLRNRLIANHFLNVSTFLQIYIFVWNLLIYLSKNMFWAEDIYSLTPCQQEYFLVLNIYVSLSTIIYYRVYLTKLTPFQRDFA